MLWELPQNRLISPMIRTDTHRLTHLGYTPNAPQLRPMLFQKYWSSCFESIALSHMNDIAVSVNCVKYSYLSLEYIVHVYRDFTCFSGSLYVILVHHIVH